MKKKIIILAALIFLCIACVSAEAKIYYQFAGHDAVRYEHSDISPSLQPYIDHVEYDLASAPGVGARLYFTSYGKNCIRYLRPGVLDAVTNAVMSAPEWSDDRSVASVRCEIYQHATWPNRMVVDIEYYYRDLKSWEVPYNSL
ncbi:MAG: hypothetical protein PHI66_01160 [Candidatus Pacebacteria bacterium]|nr:hypothetical protein [Candidatus Paceibacterota bacterium]